MNTIEIYWNDSKSNAISIYDIELNLLNFEKNNNLSIKIFNLLNMDSNYLTNLVFPNNNLSSNNIWNKISNRPFKICPINKDKLYLVSNNSILNICIFNHLNKLIGFAVISDKKDYFWIEIFCTNINQGIGSLIDNLIKLILTSKPIRLESTFNSKNFYLKKDFTILHDYILEYKKN